MALWTPSLITAALWLDADDSDTIVFDSGTNIRAWADKSGNGFNPSIASNFPTLVAAEISGKDVVRFNGTNQFLNLPATALNMFRNIGKAQIAIVYKHAAAPTAARSPFFVSSNAAANVRAAIWNGVTASNKAQAGGRRLDADSFASVTSTADVGTATWLHRAFFDWDNSDLYQYLNGALDGSNTSFQTDGKTSDTASTNIRVGAGVTTGGAGASFFNGDIAEIVVWIDNADAGQEVEGYLAHKWGLTANLPGDHPYKTLAPTAPLSYYGTVRDKAGVLAVGRGIRAIREADQVCVAYDVTDGSGEYDFAGANPDDTGTVTTASASVITDSGQAWTTDEWATHYGVRMTSGAQVGEWRRIASNTATALTLESALPGTTAINDTFEIAALHTLVFSGEADRNALVYSGAMPA